MSDYPPTAKCDVPGCGRWATTAHVLPTVSNPTRCELACVDHDAGGYWFPLDADGMPESVTMFDHLARNKGTRALLVVAMRLDIESQRRGPEPTGIVDINELCRDLAAREEAFERAGGGS